jgi:pyrroloquinoline quinone (PQQ) biosynthesis protein C
VSERFVDALAREIAPARERAINHPLLDDIAAGRLSRRQLQVFAEQLYHFLVEAEYRFSAVSVVRSPDSESLRRNFEHMLEEASHMPLWLRFAEAIGTSEEGMRRASPRPGTLAFVNYFYRLSVLGTPAEVAAGAGLPEGAFADQCERIGNGLLQHYGLSREEADFFFVHAKEDRQHEALHYWRIETYATTAAVQDRVRTAARLGFAYYVEMFDAIRDAVEEAR